MATKPTTSALDALAPRRGPEVVPDTLRFERAREQIVEGAAERPGVLDVARTALGDSRVMSWGLIRRIFDSPDDEDDLSIANGYDYAKIQDSVEKNQSWEEVQYLRENGVRGMESLRRAQAVNMMRRDDDATYARASGTSQFIGQMLAGMADPTALLTGLGIAGATARTAIGAGALVRAGRPLAAVGATIGENVAAEVLFTGLQDASGEVLGVADYATAIAGAGLLSVAFSRGTYRAAMDSQTLNEARRMAQDAHRVERDAMQRDNIEMDNDAAVAQWRTEQARRAADSVNTRTETPVIPEDLQTIIRDEAEGKVDTPPTPPVKPPETPKVEEPVTTEQPTEAIEVPEVEELVVTPDVVRDAVKNMDDLGMTTEADSLLRDYLDSLPDPERDAPELLAEMRRRNDERRTAVDTNDDGPIPATTMGQKMIVDARKMTQAQKSHDGRTIYPIRTLKQRATKAGEQWRDTTLGSMLRAAQQSQHETMVRLRPMIDLMVKRMGDAEKVPVTLLRANEGYSEGGGQILQPANAPGGGAQRVRDMTDAEVIDGMSPWSASTLIHEIAHQMTQHILRYAEDPSTRQALSPEVLRAVEVIEDVLARYTAAVQALPDGDFKRRLTYATGNIHELTAESMANPQVQKFLHGLPASKKGGGKFSTSLQELIGAVKRLFGKPVPDEGGFADMMHAIDTLFRARGSVELRGWGGEQVIGWPGAEMPKLSPVEPEITARQPLWDKWSYVANHNRMVDANPADQRLVTELTRGELKTTREVGALDQGVSTYGEFATNRRWAPVVDALKQLQQTYLPDSHLILSDILDSTKAGRSGVNGQIMTVGDNHIIGIDARKLGNPEDIIRTLVHEVGHAVFHTHARNIDPATLARMKSDFSAFVQQVYESDPAAVNSRFSITSMNRKLLQGKAMKSSDYNLNFDEFSAEQFVKFIESRTATRKDGGLVGDARAYVVDLLKAMIKFFKGTQNAGMLEPAKGFAEFFDGVITSVERDVGAPLAGVAQVNPIATVAARQKFAQRMYQHADSFMRQNPIDVARLRVLTAKMGGGLSDGLRLATSNNPILQMVASLVTETTTGAAGRRSNVAIRKETLKARLIGNSRLDFETSYEGWKRTTGVSVFDDLVSGTARRKFDRLVYTEILSRRQAPTWRSEVPTIAKAADAMEALFERSLQAQKEAGTLGADRLPDDSRGYLPQSLDGRKLAEADPQDLADLTNHLALHWETTLQWDARFSKQFAAFYINRARSRVMNPATKDFSGASAEGTAVLRDSLEEMANDIRDPDLRAEAIKAKRGLGQTKKRLDVGLLDELPSGKQVIDFYEDDTMALAMRYVNRTSGAVSLTEYGIPGPDGVRHLRDAAVMHAENKADVPTREELEAFDRVMAEIMGQPVPGEVHSNPATGVRMFVMLQRLGSMVYTQAAETVNMVHHIGIGATLKGVATLPRLLGEVGRVKRGADPANHILTHIEKWGGEFGAHQYKMVFPLDPPDARLETYTDDPGLLHRLLSAGAYYQSKLTGFRALMAAQHRMAAEQIVMKAARFLADDSGKPDIWLKDMGIDEELAGHIRNNIHEVAQWDAKGNLIAFDITRIENPKAAEAFVQAIHRGVNQIIQGTFVGERNAWAHNDWVKVLTQLRTFGLTSTEKQWARVREVTGGGRQGYAAATGLLLAQIAMVMPIIAARVHMNSIGREDREEFIEKNLHPIALARASMNYAALSGMFGDVLDIIGGLGGQLLDKEDQELIGGRQGSGAGKISDAVPAVGSLDAAGKVVTGNATVYTALKQLPFSNTPYLIPIINLFK